MYQPSSTFINPNTFPKPNGNDLQEATPEFNSDLDLDGKLAEENFGQNINENVNIEDVSERLTPVVEDKPKASKSKK